MHPLPLDPHESEGNETRGPLYSIDEGRRSSRTRLAPPDAPTSRSSAPSKDNVVELTRIRRDASTQELLDACRAGDESAWNLLVDRYEGLVWSTALEIGLDEDDAGDVFQYVWIELHRSLLRLRNAQSLPKWLMVATRRQAYKVAARRRRPLVSIDAEDGPLLLDPDNLPDERVVASENRRRLEDALARLGDKEATLLRLLFLDPSRPSYEDISTRTGLAVGSIGPIRARYLKKLRSLLEDAS